MMIDTSQLIVFDKLWQEDIIQIKVHFLFPLNTHLHVLVYEAFDCENDFLNWRGSEFWIDCASEYLFEVEDPPKADCPGYP